MHTLRNQLLKLVKKIKGEIYAPVTLICESRARGKRKVFKASIFVIISSNLYQL